MKSKQEIGATIKLIRAEKQLSQSKLANMISLTRSHLVNIEHGRHYPSLEALYKLSAALEVDLGQIL